MPAPVFDRQEIAIAALFYCNLGNFTSFFTITGANWEEFVCIGKTDLEFLKNEEIYWFV